MYKLIDKQNVGTLEKRRFGTQMEARDALRNFHSADIAGVETMTLETLLEIGDWELIEITK
jgi:hypothetical protein